MFEIIHLLLLTLNTSRQPLHHAIVTEPHADSRRRPSQPRHLVDLAGDDHDETGAVGDIGVADHELVAAGHALALGVVGDAGLGLGDTDRQPSEAVVFGYVGYRR